MAVNSVSEAVKTLGLEELKGCTCSLRLLPFPWSPVSHKASAGFPRIKNLFKSNTAD